MRYSEILNEAAPTDALKAGTYYHGTSGATAMEAIVANGLQGQEVQGKRALSPVKGMVYLTPHITYAIIYALGGNFTSSMMEAKDYSDPYGYVFVVDGSSLMDVQPDEDSVGEWIGENSERIETRWLHYQTREPLNKPDGSPMMRTTGYKCAHPPSSPEAQIYRYLQSAMTPTQFEKCLDGDAGAWASGGKRALKKMPDWMKIALINGGAHIAHGGTIRPSQCWRILKTDLKQLKKDGSNFFEVAVRIK